MKRNLMHFTVTDDVLAHGLTGAYLTMGPMQNRVGSAEFDALQEKVIQEIKSDLDLEKIAHDPVLLGFRHLHDSFQVSNRKNISAPENLLRHLLKNGDMPRVNLVVDIYNLVSLKTRLALGAHDTATITGDIELRRTDGTEKFLPIGSPEYKAVSPGEYAYIDRGDNEIICRLEVRQVEKTKVTIDTTDCFYIVQGNENTPPDMVMEATELLIDWTRRFCGGEAHLLYSP